ncbi:MAG: 3-dehydroquinate synthase II [Thermodesulfobacteriota bacterium]
MDRPIWVAIDPWDKKLVTTALEGGADALVLPDGHAEEAKALGRITVVAPDGDLVPGRDVIIHTITGSADEDEIVRLARQQTVVVEAFDWTIIPLENLIARGAAVFTRVRSADEARTALGILEQGVAGVILAAESPGALKRDLASLKGMGGQVGLTCARVLRVRALGMGDRVCVDTCTNLRKGQGMLVGNSSQTLFLVHAETVENPYVATRPFRVNAGAVHAYIRVPGDRTRYLSELAAGDEVLAVDHTGRALPVVVGRVKIERRPLLLVEAEVEGTPCATILQNAETIRLTRPDGQPISVVELVAGDEILVAREAAGRHFGFQVQETIQER